MGVGAPPISEAELQRGVIELAQALGWRVAHFRPARTEEGWRTAVSADGKGYPDLTLVRGTRCLVVELKAARGRVHPEQQIWLEAFARTPVEVYLWRPADWLSGEIEQVLRAA